MLNTILGCIQEKGNKITPLVTRGSVTEMRCLSHEAITVRKKNEIMTIKEWLASLTNESSISSNYIGGTVWLQNMTY